MSAPMLGGVFVAQPPASVGAITSDDVTNESAVPGATVTDALDDLLSDVAGLNSNAIANASAVSGATVSAALNALLRVQIAADVVAVSYDFALADAGRLVPGNNAALQTFTVLNQATRGWTQGDTILVLQKGAGQVAVAAGAGVTIRNPATYQARTLEQWAVISLIYQGSDVWVLGGDRDPV